MQHIGLYRDARVHQNGFTKSRRRISRSDLKVFLAAERAFARALEKKAQASFAEWVRSRRQADR